MFLAKIKTFLLIKKVFYKDLYFRLRSMRIYSSHLHSRKQCFYINRFRGTHGDNVFICRASMSVTEAIFLYALLP